MRDLNFPQGVGLNTAEDRQQLAEQLAGQVAEWLREALASKDRALLVVSGGRTPVAFFEALSKEQLPWSRVDITLADERWVNEDDPASNAALVRKHLVSNFASDANFIPLKTPEQAPESAIEALDSELRNLSWPIDVLILGMGNDGHTASLFPGTSGLANAMTTDRKCAVVTPLDAPHDRMTLAYPVLSAARHTVLHITGEDKSATMTKVLADLNAVEKMPVRGFIGSGLEIYWSL
ncbi:6-phosphogluconolactonase [Hahella sp. CCB-MM4]|uniref:6-phosphogluconolactonase n=1 Tax=Hahella sp. (strain CCB-MM4) TaxID=1926491 RepID=UPI000B9AA4E5|nr:6-phosphogluconolactonase [Hahella sp. CCB-MM4]OZG75311.1 6-phosphogluconolactonase [Hahella sp. CCB-MM4]